MGDCLLCKFGLIDKSEMRHNRDVNVDHIGPVALVVDPKTKKKVFPAMPKQVNPSVYFSLEEGEFDEAVFNSFGEGLKKKIMASPEYAALMGDHSGEQQVPEDTGEAPAALASEEGDPF